MDFETAFEQTKTKKHFEGYYQFYSSVIDVNKVSSILEIGVGEGASMHAWRQIWPKATIEGIDIKEVSFSIRSKFKIYSHDSINTHNADLLNKNYDLIVDDGDENWRSKLRTFFNYYEKANKYYVIENVIGQYSLNKILSKIPNIYLTDFYVFKSSGPLRSYSFRENNERIEEKNSSPYIIFFVIKNYTKRFINKSVYSENMLDIENKSFFKEVVDLQESYKI